MKYLYLILFLFVWSLLNAQPSFFEGFETFTDSGQPAPFDWQEPENWTSSNALTEFFAAGIMPTEDAYEGNYAVRLDSRKAFGQVVPARLALGDAWANYLSNTLETAGAGIPVEGNLDKLQGYYKYNTSGQDQASLVVQISRFNNGEGQIIFDTKYFFSNAEDFSLFEITFEGYSFEAGKDTLLLAFSSSAGPFASETSALIVDALSIDYLTSVKEVKWEQSETLVVSPAPVSTGQKLFIGFAEDKGTSIRSVSLLNVSGRKLYYSQTETDTIDLGQLNLQPGLYLVQVETGKGDILVKKAIAVP